MSGVLLLFLILVGMRLLVELDEMDRNPVVAIKDALIGFLRILSRVPLSSLELRFTIRAKVSTAAIRTSALPSAASMRIMMRLAPMPERDRSSVDRFGVSLS